MAKAGKMAEMEEKRTEAERRLLGGKFFQVKRQILYLWILAKRYRKGFINLDDAIYHAKTRRKARPKAPKVETSTSR